MATKVKTEGLYMQVFKTRDDAETKASEAMRNATHSFNELMHKINGEIFHAESQITAKEQVISTMLKSERLNAENLVRAYGELETAKEHLKDIKAVLKNTEAIRTEVLG